MLTVLAKLLSPDKDEKKTQYFTKIHKRNMLNTSKGAIEETPLLCTRDFLIDLLTLTQAGIKKKCGPQYANMDYRPENVYYDKETDKLDIGKQYQPGEVLTFDGDTGAIISGEPLQILVGYTEGTTGKSLGYLVSEYKNGNFVTSRITETELLEKLVVEGIACCNAFVADGDTGEKVIERKNQGFVYTIDTSDVTQLKKAENIDKEALALTEKTVKLKKENKLGQMMNTASNNILLWLSEDTLGVCTEEQKNFLAEYYSWYTKRTFEFLQGSSDIKMRASKIVALDSLHLSKNVEWRHTGYYTSPTRSFRCSDPSCGKALSKAHVFECDDENVGHVKLMFGADCAEQFFDMTSDTLTCLADASSIVESEIKNIFNIYRNNRVEEAWDELGMFKDTIQELYDNNNLVSTYGEDNAKWLSGFLAQNIPFPDSLISTVVTGITRETDEMKDDERQKRNERIHKEVNLVRSKALNTVSIGQTDEQFHAINFDFWTKKEPRYTDIIKYLPESKEYFEFVLRYKMYGRPLTGEALDKFNQKHKTTLRRIKMLVGAKKFNALELAQITEMLKLQLHISKQLDKLTELREVAKDTTIAKAIYDKFNEDFGKTELEPGMYVYMLAFMRELLPKVDVAEGKICKESLRRRRIPLSLKSRLLVPDSSYYFRSYMRTSLFYSSRYETDYDGDKYAKDFNLLGKELDSLKDCMDKGEDYVVNTLIPYLNTNIYQEQVKEREKEKELEFNLRAAKKQEDKGYQPIPNYDYFSENFCGLREEDGIELSLKPKGKGSYTFALRYCNFLDIKFDVEKLYSQRDYKYYYMYRDGVSIELYNPETYDKMMEVKVDSTTNDIGSLPVYKVHTYKIAEGSYTIVEVAEKDSHKCLVSLVAQVNTGRLVVMSTPFPSVKGVEEIFGLTHDELVDLQDEAYVESICDESVFRDDKMFLHTIITNKYKDYLKAVDKEKALEAQRAKEQEEQARLQAQAQSNGKRDLVDVLAKLCNDYPKVVSNRQNTDTIAYVINQKKKYKDLTGVQKTAVVQVICDKISANGLKREDYDLSEVPDKYINFTYYLNKDKKLADDVSKFMDAVNVGDIHLDTKMTSILTTISRSGKCSDRQKKYLDEISVIYEQAMQEKMLN